MISNRCKTLRQFNRWLETVIAQSKYFSSRALSTGDCWSGEDLSSFFEDTKYTKKILSTPAPPATDSSGFIYEPLTHIQGYISPKNVDYFIWELEGFKEGSKVILGDNLVLARITGVVGVRHNFVKFGVEMLGSSFRDDCQLIMER